MVTVMACTLALLLLTPAAAESPAAKQYLSLIENFAGFAEKHWNTADGCYDAQGKGVTWARGNGGVCLVNAVLLTDHPARAEFSPRKVKREILLEHTRLTLRKLCLTSQVCTDPRAEKTRRWGGKASDGKTWHWQAGLETEHWVLAAKILEKHLDDDTKALVKQVAGAEADAAMRPIPSARKGDTAADDCSWNAGVLGVCAAVYADDPRAAAWDDWAKKWALNMDGREPDKASKRVIDGKPLGEWITAVNTFPDLTLENHGFWDLPYQFGFAALAEPLIAYHLCGRKVPESFHANSAEIGDNIVKWLTLPDGDLLCPQGIDWAERDVQHSWGYTVLGTYLKQPWARAAEERCLKLLTARQAAFNDGSIHALDFGYETDLAVIWTISALMHKHFGHPAAGLAFHEPKGDKVFPHVASAVYRTPETVSSVSWFRTRQAVMVSPNNLAALGGRTSFTRYDTVSGTGWIKLKGDRKPRAFQVKGEPVMSRADGAFGAAFTREVPGLIRQEIGYCALPTGEVAVISRWTALKDVEVAEFADHPFRWVEIDGFLKAPEVKQSGGEWTIDGKLRMTVFGGEGERAKDGVNGIARRNFTAKAGDVFQTGSCVYQAILPRKALAAVTAKDDAIQIGPWTLSRDGAGFDAVRTKTR